MSGNNANINIGVVGSGFAGLAAASKLAQLGYNVTILEKNSTIGGRARKFEVDGFQFDMGPSWYWMPEVFENYYAQFGYKVSDFYELKRLDPSYKIFFKDNQHLNIPASIDELYQMFEDIEKGSSIKLKKFLKDAQYKYEVGMSEFVWKPSHSIFEFVDFRVVKSAFGLQMFSSIAKVVRSSFKNEKLRALLEFPVLFLGATPEDTPALYSLMNYADLSLGTWYPLGGMHKIVEAFEKIALELGVNILCNEEVTSVDSADGQITKLITEQNEYHFDHVIAACDYNHFDQKILDENQAQYSIDYWDKRVMAPSSLLFYLGVDKKLPDTVHHHNLFFDESFDLHAIEIYKDPQWPTKPLFYLCASSKSDNSVAPAGMENVFLLMPLAPDLEDSNDKREEYFDLMCDRIQKRVGFNLKDHIVFKRSFAMNDFQKEYNSFKGNAYGLANTLLQTAFLKPKMKSKKLKNLLYAGQLTTPGPGVPPSIISGLVAASEIHKYYN